MTESAFQDKLRVHRWLSSEESIPVSVASALLEATEARSSEIVYDPFVGYGTIPVVCAEKGLLSYSCDINNLAALTTQVKLHPPSISELIYIEHIIEQEDRKKFLQHFANRNLPSLFSGLTVKVVQFVLAAALVRIGWHKENPLDFNHLSDEIIVLLEEMRADITSNSPFEQNHRVSSCDFLTINHGDILSFSESQIIMITSPPFFGSNINPRIQLLADLIGKPVLRCLNTSRPPDWCVPEALTVLKLALPRSEDYNKVADYLYFLDCIVIQAAELGCRAVAIEMGQSTIDGQAYRFDLFFAQRMAAHNYRIKLFEEIESCPEIITAICAQYV